jgi:hypothetical protein
MKITNLRICRARIASTLLSNSPSPKGELPVPIQIASKGKRSDVHCTDILCRQLQRSTELTPKADGQIGTHNERL